MKRRVTQWMFLAVLGLTGCEAASPSTDPAFANFPYAELDINDLQTRMQGGELDSRTLTQAYLDRIASLDRRGPMLRSVIEVNPAAIKEATLRDQERRRGKARGPLHGIPILLKDTIAATPMANSAGSLALQNFRPRQDAFLVQRLRQAGAVILGKTNLSEWSNFRSSHARPGWSARGGQIRNPYLLDHSSCGSNSGTAVAVAANLAAAAIGGETHGTLACPAADNGLVALRPTVGLVSRTGLISVSYSQDTAGPVARSVTDAALLLAVIAGRDEADPITRRAAWNITPDYPARLNMDALKGKRIGVLRYQFSTDPEAATAMQAAIAMLQEAGATVVDAHIPTAGQWREDEQTLLLYEFKAGLDRYLSANQAPVRSMGEVIAFNRKHAKRELALFDQDLLERANATGGLGNPDYIAARSRAQRLAGREGIDAALQAQRLDALVAPAVGSAWSADMESDGHNIYNAASVAGYPALTVPIGNNRRGLPLGMVLMGTAWSESQLLGMGYAYEQRTRARQPPQFLSGKQNQAQ